MRIGRALSLFFCCKQPLPLSLYLHTLLQEIIELLVAAGNRRRIRVDRLMDAVLFGLQMGAQGLPFGL